MKTTLELPDELLIAAKQVAAQRRTTLKELVTHSLRREIGLDSMEEIDPGGIYELSVLGLPVLKKRGAKTDEVLVKNLESAIEEEDRKTVLRNRKA